MNRERTGALIAQVRKEKSMTQKELARVLHVTDRAVSKWERGAGFPDISLLEPLAEVLELQVLDLLRGERTGEADCSAAAAEAVDRIRRERLQLRRERRRSFWQAMAALLLLGFTMSCFGLLQIPVHRTQSVCVYREGEPTAVTEVLLDGKILVRPWGWTYAGRFATPWAPGSSWEGLRVRLDYSPLDPKLRGKGSSLDTSKGYVRGEIGLQDYYISPFLREFAAQTEAGEVLATSPEMYQRYVSDCGGTDLQMVPFCPPELAGDPRAQYTGGYPPHIS